MTFALNEKESCVFPLLALDLRLLAISGTKINLTRNDSS
uniref:Uncharacterized protein n=1 Tax=Anguilla anguilla TaxID=7936 RepID=A0A0E9SDD0_ANGAN